MLAGARLAGLPPLSALLSGPPAQFAALLVFLVGVAFAAFLWWLAARSFAFLRDPRTTPEQLASLRELPLALPEGTVRALLALIVGVVGLPLLLFSQALVAAPTPTAGYVNGIIAGVFGYYFGARSTAADAAATRRLGDALAGQGRHAEALREENAALRDRAAEAAEAAGARPGQLAAALDTLGRQIAIAGNLLEVIGPALPPGLLPAGAADALRRARAVAAEAGALAAGEADAATLGRVLDATAALVRPRRRLRRPCCAPPPAPCPPIAGGGPLAAVSLLLGLGWQAGSAAWRRWRAQVLARAARPGAVRPRQPSRPSSAALRLENAPIFAAAFATLRDRPGFAADLLDIALRDDAPARLWAEHGERFASPEAAAAGLAEFRRALLAESAAADVSAPAVAAVAVRPRRRRPRPRARKAPTPEAARALLLAAGSGGRHRREPRRAASAGHAGGPAARGEGGRAARHGGAGAVKAAAPLFPLLARRRRLRRRGRLADPPLAQLARWRSAAPDAIAAEPVVAPCPAANPACPRLHALRAEACLGRALATRAPGAACPPSRAAPLLDCAAEGYAAALAAAAAVGERRHRAPRSTPASRKPSCAAPSWTSPPAPPLARRRRGRSRRGARRRTGRAARRPRRAAARPRSAPPPQRCAAARRALALPPPRRPSTARGSAPTPLLHLLRTCEAPPR